jgi:hypothetical protein
MYKILLLLLLCGTINASWAQKTRKNEQWNRITVEPAIGTRLSTLMGSADIGLSNLIQYNLHRSVSLLAHTAVSFDFENRNKSDIHQNYSYTLFQKIGLGTSVYTKRTMHTVSFLIGVKYNAYSGTLTNSELSDAITTKTQSLSPDYGLMYNLKLGANKYFFSGRIYIPLQDGYYGIIENAHLELGVGIRLKNISRKE